MQIVSGISRISTGVGPVVKGLAKIESRGDFAKAAFVGRYAPVLGGFAMPGFSVFPAMNLTKRLFSTQQGGFSALPTYWYKQFENQNRAVGVARANTLNAAIAESSLLKGRVGLEIAIPFAPEMTPAYVVGKMNMYVDGLAVPPNIFSLKEMSGSSTADQIGTVMRAMLVNLAEKYPVEKYPELWGASTAMDKDGLGQRVVSRDAVNFMELLRDWSQSVFATRVNVKSPLLTALTTYLGWMKSARLVAGAETAGGTTMQIDELFMQRNFEGTVSHEASQLAKYGLSGRTLVRATTGHNMVDLVTSMFTRAMGDLGETFMTAYDAASSATEKNAEDASPFLGVALHFHNQFKNAFPAESAECDAAIAAAIIETATFREETGFLGAKILVDLLVGSRAYGFSSLLDVESQLQKKGYTLDLSPSELQHIRYITVVERLTEIAFEAARVPNNELPPHIVKKANIAGGATGPIVSDLKALYAKVKPELSKFVGGAQEDDMGLQASPTHPRDQHLDPEYQRLLEIYAEETAEVRSVVLPGVSPVTPGQANLHKYVMDRVVNRLGGKVTHSFMATNNWNEWIRPAEFPNGPAEGGVLKPVLESRMESLVSSLVSQGNTISSDQKKKLQDMVMSPREAVQDWMQAQGFSLDVQAVLLNIVGGETVPECLTAEREIKVPNAVPDAQKAAWKRMATRHGSESVPSLFYNVATRPYPNAERFDVGTYADRRAAYQQSMRDFSVQQQGVQGGFVQIHHLQGVILDGDAHYLHQVVDHHHEGMFARFESQVQTSQLAPVLTAKIQRDNAHDVSEKRVCQDRLREAFDALATTLSGTKESTLESYLKSYEGHVLKLWIAEKEKETIQGLLQAIYDEDLCSAITLAANIDLGVGDADRLALAHSRISRELVFLGYSRELVAATVRHRENYVLDAAELVLGQVAKTYNAKTPDEICQFVEKLVADDGLSEALVAEMLSPKG